MSHGILWEVPQKVLIAVNKLVLFLMGVGLFPALSLSQLLFIFFMDRISKYYQMVKGFGGLRI